MEVKINSAYRHFKGFIAHVLAIAEHTETGEKLVVYECSGDCVDSPHKDGIYARPYDMFCSKVDRTKYPDAKQEYRFEEITT